MNKFKAEKRYVLLASGAEDLTKFNFAVGKGCRRLRESKGMSQKELAELLNCCRNTVVQIELGQREKPIPLKTIYKILNVLASTWTLDEFLDFCKFP